MAAKLWVISNVAHWALTVFLFVAVFLLYRHLGREGAAKALAKEAALRRQGPQVGSEVALTVTTIDGATHELTPSPNEQAARPQLIFFAAQGCKACEKVRPHLATLASSHAELDVVVIKGANSENTRKYVRDMPDRTLVVADVNRELFRHWGIDSTPFAVFSDSKGIVRMKGIVSSYDALKSFFEGATV